MNNPKISILVPVYKVEKYLRRCVASVLSQDFYSFELILVDDGSPDGSPAICDEYAAADQRVKVVHKPNGGLVSARLAAFSLAQGKYLIFLDSDDYLYPNAISILYEKAKEGYDIVKGRNVGFTDTGIVRTEGGEALLEINSPQEYAKAILTKEILPYLWGGIYKKELFSTMVFEGLLGFSIFEDELTNLAIWRNVQRYCAVPDIVCAYYINAQSMMQQKVVSLEYLRKKGAMQERYLGNGKISYWAKVDNVIGQIKSIFTPEIGWRDDVFFNIRAFVRNAGNKEAVRKYSDSKFLLFVENKWLYKMYASLYRFLFLHIRLKGHRRQLI